MKKTVAVMLSMLMLLTSATLGIADQESVQELEVELEVPQSYEDVTDGTITLNDGLILEGAVSDELAGVLPYSEEDDTVNTEEAANSGRVSGELQKNDTIDGFEIEGGVLVKYKGIETDVYIPDTVTSIGKSAFEGCKNIESIYIPSTVTSVGDHAFASCYALKSLVIPDSVTHIGRDAFGACMGLSSLVLPNGLTEIGFQMVCYCHNLTSITIPASVTSIEELAFQECSSLESIIIPGSVKSVGKQAFKDCTALTSVTIENGVQTIGEEAFRNCTSLAQITVPASVTEIEYGAFMNCNSMTDATILANITVLHGAVFESCSKLANVTLPGSLKELRDEVFYQCNELVEVVIPDGVTSIGYTFRECFKLARIWVPASVTSFGRNDYPFITSDSPNVTLYGKAGSMVESYAKSHGYTFVADKVEPTSISLNRSGTVTVAAGSKLQLEATFKPEGASADVTWTSTDPKVATVSDKGEVHALNKGKATITATTDKGLKASVTLKVSTAPTKIALNKTKATVVAGASLALKAKLTPSGAKTTLTWTSSNKKVATVSSKGVVKSLKKGTAIITVSTKNGKQATCKITVPTAPRSVKFAKKSYTVNVNKTVKLVTKLTPADAKTILTWSSSNKKIATVSSKGVVKGLKKGTAKITVQTANGKTATVNIKVQ